MQLKKAFCDYVPLKLINYNKPFIIEVDASKYAIGWGIVLRGCLTLPETSGIHFQKAHDKSN